MHTKAWPSWKAICQGQVTSDQWSPMRRWCIHPTRCWIESTEMRYLHFHCIAWETHEFVLSCKQTGSFASLKLLTSIQKKSSYFWLWQVRILMTKATMMTMKMGGLKPASKISPYMPMKRRVNLPPHCPLTAKLEWHQRQLLECC